MTLRGRLLLSALALSFVVAALFALIIRRAWQVSEEERFLEEYQAAVGDLDQTLEKAATDLEKKLAPLCEHDPMVDSALIGLEGDTLSSRLLSLQATIPDMARSLSIDELLLVDDEGHVIAGVASPALPSEVPVFDVTERERAPGLVMGDTPAFEAACLKKSGRRWVALLGRTHLEPLLKAQGKAHHLTLELVAPLSERPATTIGLSQEMHPTILGDASIVASRSSQPLSRALEKLNTEIATAFALAVVVALLAALVQSKSLSKPIVQFAKSTRDAALGQAQKIPETGGPELKQAALAFNQTLDALDALRKQLAITERIAARREVARQIAHEIKNPLSPIRTSIETLQKLHDRKHPDFDEYFNETTRIVLQEVMRLSHLVGHFARYASLPSPQLAEVAIDELCHQVAQLNAQAHTQLRVTVEPKTTPLTLLADKDQLTQVLTNLIKNALEATADKSEGLVEVVISLDEKLGLVHVDVLDNGPGASNEAQLFEPYKTTKAGGTGLGLPISHRIAVEHGGDLTYRTRSEGGAAFRLTLPIAGPPRLGNLA